MIKKIKKKILEIKFDRIRVFLLVILIAGFLIRVLGVYPGYSPYHPDEGKAGYSSAWFMFMNKTLDLPHYHYPALIPTIELFFMVIFFIPILWIKLLAANPDVVLSNLNKLPEIFQNYIALRSDVEVMFLSRYLMVVFGVLTVIFSYLTAKNLFSSRLVGIFTALILAFNLRAVTSSQLDLPDGYSSFFLIFCLYIFSRLKKTFSMKYYILSGVSIGLAISSKLQFFSLLPFIALHLYHTLIQRSLSGKLKTLISKKIFFFTLFLIFTITILNIGPLTHLDKFYETMERQSNLYGFGFNKLGLTGLAYFYNVVLTPGVVILFLIGVIFGFLRHKLGTFLIILTVGFYLYYFLFLTRGWFYPRNFVSVVPLFAILAGLGMETVRIFLHKHFKNSFLSGFLLALVICAALFTSIKDSVVHTLSYSKPWNITSMRSCIGSKLPSDKVIAAHPTDKYILFSLPSFDVSKNLKFIPINIESSYNLAELQEEKADFALVGLDVVQDSNSVWWMAKPTIWDKPVDVSKNLFVSLAANELFQNTVCAAVKPWQAVENNYALVAVTDPIETNWQKLKTFEFNSEDVNWIKIDGFSGRGNNLVVEKEDGKENPGSLKIISVSPIQPVVRWVSPPFDVKPAEAYKVEAWIKSTIPIEQKRRDGFLRLDFYGQVPEVWNEGMQSDITHLSSRYFGAGEWKKVVVSGEVPEGVEFATISFQASSPSVADLLLDDVTLYKGEDFKIQKSGFKFIPDIDVFVPNLGSGY